jgi:hypothetical protein
MKLFYFLRNCKFDHSAIKYKFPESTGKVNEMLKYNLEIDLQYFLLPHFLK